MATARPILFSAPMVRALLAGRKTQTRRIVKPQPSSIFTGFGDFLGTIIGRDTVMACVWKFPYGESGDLLWVRETLTHDATRGHFYAANGDALDYEREPPPSIGLPMKSISSIHMPRWASRITLRITDVRVERLQEISEDDAIAEGIDGPLCAEFTTKAPSRFNLMPAAVHAFFGLWESLNGEGSWAANPWVWVLSFEVIRSNVDKVAA